MTRKFFGTDGVRGRANRYPMTAEMALRLGAAAGRYFRREGSPAHRVVIGKDTRLSSYMLENANARATLDIGCFADDVVATSIDLGGTGRAKVGHRDAFGAFEVGV